MALGENVNTTSTLTTTMQTYYDRRLLQHAKPELVHYKFAAKKRIPRNSGKVVNFRRWVPFDAATTALTEGENPDGQTLSQAYVTATVADYGGYVEISDLLDLTAVDPVIDGAIELMGEQAGLTVDHLVRDELTNSTNIQYAGSSVVLETEEMTQADNKLTVDEIRKARRTLKKNKARPFKRNGKSYYVAIVGPDACYDLQSDPAWESASLYGKTEQIFDGEIGRIYGVLFVETTEPYKYEAEALTPNFDTLTALAYNESTKVVTVSENIDSSDTTALSGKQVIINGTIDVIASADAASNTITLTTGISGISEGDVIVGTGGAIDGSPVYVTPVFGEEAFAAVDVENGGGAFQSIVHPASEIGGALNRFSTVGWKTQAFTAKVLNPDWLVLILHTATE